MKINFPVLVLLTLISFANLRADDGTVIGPLPTVPAGMPLATFPMPRLDWNNRFKTNLEQAKVPHDFIWDGDSITDNFQSTGKAVWDAHFGKIKIADFGISGDQVQYVLWRVQHGQLDGQDPKLVMLMIGANNFGQNPADVATGIKLLLGEYEKRCPHAQILLLGLFPRSVLPTDMHRVFNKEVNSFISSYGSDPRVTYLDFGEKFLQPDGTLPNTVMPDALHPGPAGYEIWANAITPVVEKYFPGQTAPVPAAK